MFESNFPVQKMGIGWARLCNGFARIVRAHRLTTSIVECWSPLSPFAVDSGGTNCRMRT